MFYLFFFLSIVSFLIFSNVGAFTYNNVGAVFLSVNIFLLIWRELGI